MSVYSQAELLKLIGEERIPTGRGVPAAWWITTNPEQIAAYDRWRADYAAHCNKVLELSKALGCTEAPRISSFGKRTFLAGFIPPHGMTLWREHPDHIPIPPHWRIDSKSGYLVPSRKTKADRESDANAQLTALKHVPNVRAYVSGLPTEIELDDRDFGGTLYAVNYIRGEHCLIAYSGGDPDRARSKPDVDTTIWEHQRLSALIALREQKQESDSKASLA